MSPDSAEPPIVLTGEQIGVGNSVSLENRGGSSGAGSGGASSALVSSEIVGRTSGETRVFGEVAERQERERKNRETIVKAETNDEGEKCETIVKAETNDDNERFFLSRSCRSATSPNTLRTATRACKILMT